MLRVLFTAMLLGLAFGTPAAAQWQYAERNGVARASVLGANGTELALYCTAEPGDRNDMFFDFLTIPIAASTDDEELMRFTVGTWSFRMETIAAGPRERGLQRYRSRVDYVDSVISNIRRQLSGGSVVRFEDTFETAAMSFNLRGSRAAIARLEAACPRLWAGRPAPQPVQAPPPPAPQVDVIPDDALLGLQISVRDQITPNCAPGVPVLLNEATMFQVSGADVTVWLNQAQCAWVTAGNPYCVGGRCAFWQYRYVGGQFQLIRTGQQ